jgi:pyruvate/2-oxoglutarate dehydrogenase complex dihydrolipoamide acyltransferase (E2) component
MSLVQAHEDLNDVAQDIALKELQLTLTQGKLEDAEKAVRDAQEVLEEAKSKSPLIISPFDGFITKVNVEGGDEVMTGTVAVQIADPNKFEAEILVSEMDILQVTLGMPASVEVDAAQGMSFPASVTHISPTATIQQGVVNYQVRVELQSLVPAETAATSSTQGQTEFSAEAFPQRLNQAVNEGHITQEQADEMLKQMQQAQAGQQGQTSTAIPQDFQLREGLTVTVSIIVDERKDVLLVPNAAINSQGGQSYVQVVTTSGETGKRVIQTGITDYQFTEVIEGLTEGEQVVVPQGTTITTISQQQRGGIMIPGMGPR